MFYLKEIYSDTNVDTKNDPKIADFIIPPADDGQPIQRRYAKEGCYLIEPDDPLPDGIKEMSIPKSFKQIFFPYFGNMKKQNHRILVTGKSGSGKSYIVGMMLDQMATTFPDHQIVIISFVQEDESLDRPRGSVIPLRMDLSNPDIFEYSAKFFNNCILVFDDVEKGVDRKLVQYLLKLREMCFEISRHHNTHLISISHNMIGGTVNIGVKAEASGVFMFPKHNQPHQSQEYLRKYVGLDKQQIEEIMKTPSRWVYLNLNAPNYYITDRKIKLLI